MPSLLDHELEERYGDILDQLRAARVEPSPELEHRVRMLGRLEPAPRRARFRGVLVPALAAAVLVAAAVAGVAVLRGLGGGAGDGEEGASLGLLNRDRAGVEAQVAPEAEDTEVPAPAAGRLQDFRAELAVRVEDADELPRATQRAMDVAQSLGGHVVSASYDGGESDSLVVLRVPIARAQDAIARLTALGELAGQRYSLQDLQATVDGLDAQADRLQERIAELEAQLAEPGLTRGERAALRNRVEQSQRELQELLAQRDSTAAQGRSAEIALRLTAERAESAPGVIDRAIDALESVWVWVLAVLIVGAPFALLLVAAALLARRLRRRADERLLEAN